MVTPWTFAIFTALLLIGVTSEYCPEAQTEIGVCLHTYLERDFTGLEPYVELKGKPDLIDGPEIETHCKNLKEVVTCYSELDGSCFHLLVRMRYSYLINGLFELITWLCDDNQKFKDLLVNLHCIEQVRQSPDCRLKGVPPNIWQQMLRLQVGDEACQPLREQLECLNKTQLMRRQCGALTNQMFVYGIETWLQNWCSNGSKTLGPCICVLGWALLTTIFGWLVH